jgi:hypothetical protein
MIASGLSHQRSRRSVLAAIAARGRVFGLVAVVVIYVSQAGTFFSDGRGSAPDHASDTLRRVLSAPCERASFLPGTAGESLDVTIPL